MRQREQAGDEMAKILIIDEYPSLRELLAEELACEGHLVVALGNPLQFKELITTFTPDLVLLDPYMKGKERWDLLEGIKKQAPNLPALILTPCSDTKKDPWWALADEYVVKSSCLDELKKKLSETLHAQMDHQPAGGNMIKELSHGYR